MKISKTYLLALFLLTNSSLSSSLRAQGCAIFDDIRQSYEIQASLSDGKTPLWLNANRYGLSSLNDFNGYARVTFERETKAIFPYRTLDSYRYQPNKTNNEDSYRYDKGLRVGYCMDLVAPLGYKDPNHTTRFIIQQAYLDLQFGLGQLTIGSRQQPMELRDNQLSSGAQTLGINARPVPQVRLGLNDFWSLPYTHDWLGLKAHLSFGVMTDGDWQEDFSQGKGWWTHNTLYHQKAGYLRIGTKEKLPVQVTLGLEMAAQFGGDVTEVWKNGTIHKHNPDKGLKAYWHALTASGNEWYEEDIVYKNADGNQVGSWVGRVDWQLPAVSMGLYADHFFEDHSAMFFLDYDGYGQGANWDSHEKKNFFQYRLRDVMIGTDATLHQCKWLQHITLEWMNTRYQSGPIYHDHSPNLSNHISGRDDYYNHTTYAGWMHYGQVIGNPLYRSAVYNEDGDINVKDNRFRAIHLGLSGQPGKRLSYRLLASWQSGLGTYENPYTCVRYNSSYMLEGIYSTTSNLSVKAAFGLDRGSILGDNTGAQFTVLYKL